MARTIPLLLSVVLLQACGPTGSPQSRPGTTARQPPPRARAKVRPNVLPIPEAHGALHFDLARLRTTSLYRLLRSRLKVFLGKTQGATRFLGDLAKTCAFDLERDVQTVTIAADIRKGHSPTIIVVRTRKTVRPLMRCLPKLMHAPLTTRPIRFGPLKGWAASKDGALLGEVLALDDHRLVFMGPKSRRAVREVLTGDRRSLTQTLLYRSTHGTGSTAPMMMAVIPVLQEQRQGRTRAPFLLMLALGVSADVVAGGLHVRGLLPCDTEKTAKLMLKLAPTISAFMQGKSPVLAKVVNKVRMTIDPADPTVIRFTLELNKAELTPLLKLVDKVLKPAQKTTPARP